ncbi:hypothetical protein MA16_Dca017157 [Dendrobium catenatum]|uniref:Uncharacterized protein n=1 Tax=Dendrobium catenatum TaxID=906689 RepID=A0A2I0V861_9ASPA|nr:hypothetical protein MA16_Dca017157 [Dendrobium catenatum]
MLITNSFTILKRKSTSFNHLSDPGFGSEGTVEEYMDHILFTLVDVIDEQQPTRQRKITERPPVSPTMANSPLIKTVGILCLSVASLGLLTFILR